MPNKIYTSVEQLIGNTPILELTHIEADNESKATILGKLESFNPAGSAKDRVAISMLNEAESTGIINKDSVIIEPTSGNTGIGLASIGATRGYRVIIVMPDSMSVERITLMKAYGAEVVLSPGRDGMAGAIKTAEEIKENTPNSFIVGQFVNPANPKAHYLSTGPEIYRDTEGKVDIFVAGVGTGGTVSGVGKYLKEQNPNIKVVAVEPKSSPMISNGVFGPHKIQGIGANFVPDILDRSVIDEVMTVSDERALQMAREVATKEGILVGISSGAAVAAALELASHPENAGKTIVALLPDGGDHYLSTELYTY